MFFQKLLVIKLILFVLICNKLVLGQKLLKDLLPKGYDRQIAPTFNGSAVDVNVSVAILSVFPEPDIKMVFDVDLFLHLNWKDYRLEAIDGFPEKITLSHEWRTKLWFPDAYFRNAISGGVAKDELSPSFYFVLTNKTNIFMAARLRMKIGCNMKFHKYPFDRQLCFMNITTLSQNLKEVKLNWKYFKIGTHITLPEYQILSQTQGKCSKTYSSLGRFPCLYVAIDFKRNVGNYLIKRFVPSFLIVSMSFIGFWIPTQIAPARVSLIITALLALIAQQIQSELNVSYVYALQVWTIMCISFVFATLFEYAIALSWKLTQHNNNQIEGQTTKRRFFNLRATNRNCIIDIISRILFPLTFLLALTVFSVTYAKMAD